MSKLPRRREILKLSALALGAIPSACYRAGSDPQLLSEEESARFFPQSIASGDPRPDSVVLWVRALDPERPQADTLVELVLALDEKLSHVVSLNSDALVLRAGPESDHCLGVRIGGLMPGTTYYYCFRYTRLEGVAQSRVGRTRTAPAEDFKGSVKFAVVCCQDYGAKYFHVARDVANQDVDFVLHLGDYVYETTGDPAFQSTSDERKVVFTAPEEALELGSDERRFLAAGSLSNYRDLYKIYRSDPDLQALHERHPIIAIWDDHEFSDDSHGDVATYLDGTKDETSPERRAACDQAWFEYMPIDYAVADAEAETGAPSRAASRFDAKGKFPDNFAIYRSFVFGEHLELVLTDLRRFRPDHLVPEDAAPGAVFLTADDVAELLDAPPADLVPYVDIESYAKGAYQTALSENADQLAIDPDSLRGDFSAVWINQALATLELAEPAPIELEALPRGYAYHSLLKTKQYSRLGSRYVVAVGPFEALAKKRWRDSDQQSENLMGTTQREWFLKTLRDSTRTFKIWGSEVAFQARHIDLTQVEAAPPELRQKLSVSAEDWDGFPNERRALLRELADVGDVLVLSGDLHCFFAGTPYLETDEDARLVEFTTSSVTSTTWLDSIEGSLTSDSSLPMNVKLLVQSIGVLLADTEQRPNPHLAYQDLAHNGYSLVEVGPSDVLVTLRSIDTKQVAKAPSELSKKLDDLFAAERFRVRHGSAQLEREVDGEYLTWSRKDMQFA